MIGEWIASRDFRFTIFGILLGMGYAFLLADIITLGLAEIAIGLTFYLWMQISGVNEEAG